LVANIPFVAAQIRRHRRRINSPWRALNPGQQALLVLVYLRKGESFGEVGAGFEVSTATCWRYVNETVELLADRAPKLRAALREVKRQGMAYVVIDGTLIPIDRVAADRPYYSGKHRMHGMNLQVVSSPDGSILWVSGALPGSTHDTAAARIWNTLAALREAGLIALGDKRYHGIGPEVITPTGAEASPPRRRPPTVPTPGFAVRANAPTPNSRPGGCCASCGAALTAPAGSPRPSTCCKTAN
jgi:hypothetical protein